MDTGSDAEGQRLEYEYRKQRYEGYIKDRDALRHDLLEISGRYDKAILLLSGGSLALSVTFMEKIVPHPQGWTLFVLGAAWLSIIVSVLSELFALASSQTASNAQMEALNQEYDRYLHTLAEVPAESGTGQNLALPQAFTAPKNRIRLWNRLSLSCLTLGLVLLCAFSIFNLIYS